jgi:hypothetical protein
MVYLRDHWTSLFLKKSQSAFHILTGWVSSIFKELYRLTKGRPVHAIHHALLHSLQRW